MTAAGDLRAAAQAVVDALELERLLPYDVTLSATEEAASHTADVIDRMAAVLALIPEGAVLVTEAELAVLSKVYQIASVSLDGDPFYAFAYGIKDGDKTLDDAAVILRHLREGT